MPIEVNGQQVLTAEELDAKLKEIKDETSKTVNSAITQRIKGFEEKLDGTLEKKFTDLAEKLKPGDGGGGEGDQGDKGKKGGDPEWKRELEAERKKREAIEKQLADERKAREAIEQRRRADEEDTAVMGALRELGVPEHFVKPAHLLLRDMKVIARGEEDAIVAKVKKDGYEEAVDVKKYLADHFLKSDTGKAFLPATGAGGSGAGAGKKGAGGGSGNEMTADKAANILLGGILG